MNDVKVFGYNSKSERCILTATVFRAFLMNSPSYGVEMLFDLVLRDDGWHVGESDILLDAEFLLFAQMVEDLKLSAEVRPDDAFEKVSDLLNAYPFNGGFNYRFAGFTEQEIG